MMKKRKFINDGGYTLVEMIIVIAVIAILTGAAFATLSILSTARTKEAATTFYSEVNTLRSRAMNETPEYDADHDGTKDTKDPGLYHDLKIFRDGKNIYAKRSLASDATTDTGYDVVTNTNGGKGSSLTSYIELYYTAPGGTRTQLAVNDSDFSLVVFNKAGECISGYGTYEFCKKSGSTITTVTINKNGSCRIK